MVTPQTNTTLEAIAEALLAQRTLCVCGHVHPDGDCLGSTLGLVWVLRSLGKDATPLLAEDSVLDESMAFLPLAQDAVSALSYAATDPDPVDVFVCVDVPNEERLGEVASSIKDRAAITITIDHHAVPEAMSELSYTDPDITSTTMLVWELAKHLGMDPERDDLTDLATCVYTGLCTDSGRFSNQNTDALAFGCARELVEAGADPAEIARHLFQERTLASMKLDGLAISHARLFESDHGTRCAISYISSDDMRDAEATDDDAENTVSILRALKDTDVVCMLKERDGSIRGSFRAKDDSDVASLANRLGGGGHRAAAGFTLSCSLPEALALVTEQMATLGA